MPRRLLAPLTLVAALALAAAAPAQDRAATLADIRAELSVLAGEIQSLRAELLAGPAGGGGINTSGGAIFQPMAGLSWRLSKNLDFALMAGKLRSLRSDLDTGVLDLGLVYRFNTLESR